MGTSESLADLDDRPLSPRQRYAAVLVAFGEFIDGCDLIVILSVPLFALALMVSRLPFLDSGGRSLEAIAGD